MTDGVDPKTLEEYLAERFRFDKDRKRLRTVLRLLIRWYDSGDDDFRPWRRARMALRSSRWMGENP
jgi:hypothetical protein